MVTPQVSWRHRERAAVAALRGRTPVWPLLIQSKAIVKEKPLPRGEEKEEIAFLVSSRLQTLQGCPNTG